MSIPDYRGARGANTGDEFHELWAAQQCLLLLEPDSKLKAITLEGLRAEDETPTSSTVWEGVDCGLYYEANTSVNSERIIIDQLKYSGSAPQTPWTVARLTSNTRRSGNNCVVRRLADAYREITEKRGGSTEGVSLRLVSNQPVDPIISRLFEEDGRARLEPPELAVSREQLVNASGLSGTLFEGFWSALDLNSRTGSRFELEERVLRTISSWTEGDGRAVLNALLRFVGKKMLPEAKGEVIERADVLLVFGFSSQASLFPCPTEVRQIEHPVPRNASATVVGKMLAGEMFLCLHGVAGCGKTTVLQQIEARLPSGSAMVIFDCYGAGRYLNSDGYRHRPQDAFLQLSNDLAGEIHAPLLLTRARDTDYPRAFRQRLNLAAEVVAAKNPNALLVVAVDASDNSVLAAQTCVPAEQSFVHDFANLGNLAKNIRLIVTTRTGCISDLHLPQRFTPIKVEAFDRGETKAHLSHFFEMRIPMKLVSDSDLIPVTGSEVKAVVFGAKRRWRSYGA